MASSPPPAEPSVAQDIQDSAGVPTPQTKKISLNILHTVKNSQQQFGLRHADYQRYRKYCARRLTRLRKSLKFSHQTGAKGTATFQKKPVEPHMVTDERYFLLVLFRCERAWAYSMQLKQDREIQTNNSRLIHHQMRRLDKAAKYAEVLERISVRGDDNTALDATAYAGYMQGIVALEREHWESALTHLAKASAIYSKLAVVRAGAETNQLCKEKVEEIDHRIRFCLRELRKAKGQVATTQEIKDESTQDVIAKLLKGQEELTSKLESVVSDAAKKPSSDSHEVSWKGQRLPIQNEKLLALVVNAQKLAQDLESNSSSSLETQLPLFEQLFIAYSDATRQIKEEITTLQKNSAGKGKAKDPQEQSLNGLQEYITYLKLLASVHRTVVLADAAYTTAVTDVTPVDTSNKKKKHPDEMVRLYENVLHGMSEIETLLHGTVQDPEDVKVTAAKLVLYKASRCYWLAASFAAVGQTDKAVALFDRASELAAKAATEFAAASRASAADRARLARLEKDIATGRAKARAKAFLATLSQNKQEPTPPQKDTTPKDGKLSTSLATSLSTFDSSFVADKQLIDFPPNLEAIPCKPLLFDLALNDCTFPDLEARKKAPAQKGGGGIFSFWRS